MKRLGIGKKDKGDGDEDSGRRALFGSKNKSNSPAPPSQNPYAQTTIPHDPYTQAKVRAGLYTSQAAPQGLHRPGYPLNQDSGYISHAGSQQSIPPAGRYAPSSGENEFDRKFGPSQGGYNVA